VRPLGAELIESREILPGQWLQSWHAPAIASGARAGQVVHVRTVEAGGLPLRRVFPITTADPVRGSLTIQAAGLEGPTGGSPPPWARGLREGDRLDLAGPFGRPFEVDPRARHLLLVAEGPSIAGLRLPAAVESEVESALRRSSKSPESATVASNTPGGRI